MFLYRSVSYIKYAFYLSVVVEGGNRTRGYTCAAGELGAAAE